MVLCVVVTRRGGVLGIWSAVQAGVTNGVSDQPGLFSNMLIFFP